MTAPILTDLQKILINTLFQLGQEINQASDAVEMAGDNMCVGTPKEIAARHNISVRQVSGAISRLYRRGILVRGEKIRVRTHGKNHPDLGQTQIWLTDLGLKYVGL